MFSRGGSYFNVFYLDHPILVFIMFHLDPPIIVFCFHLVGLAPPIAPPISAPGSSYYSVLFFTWLALLHLLLRLVGPTIVFFTWLDWHLLLYLLHLFHLVELAPTVGCTYCTWFFTWFFTWLDLLWCCSPGWTGRFPLFAAAISRRSRLPCRKGLLQVF